MIHKSVRTINSDSMTSPGRLQGASNTAKDGRLACLPSVYLAGFPKCGTTDLYNSLISHYHIIPGKGKELDFWTKHNTASK